MLTLHTAPGSCSRASHIALEEARLDYQARFVDFAKADQRQPDFLAINPKGRVPALVTDRGVLTEGPAILAYVAAGGQVAAGVLLVVGLFTPVAAAGALAYLVTGIFVVATLIVGAELLYSARIAVSTGDQGLLDLSGVLADRYGEDLITDSPMGEVRVPARNAG